nr:aldehyde dehydrogenase family protein [Novosphingobium sp. Rr 2-17]
MIVPFGADRFARVGAQLAAAFKPGDALIICQSDGELLHVTASTRRTVYQAISGAQAALRSVSAASAEAIGQFFDDFADRLDTDDVWSEIELANLRDVARARDVGRDVGRLTLRLETRREMVHGLRTWSAMARRAEAPISMIEHEGWSIEAHRDSVGTIGFVFEGRPNVLVDACGVIASRNTAVLRIGDDASETATAIYDTALKPALHLAGLPASTVGLLPRLGREAAWALFTDKRLALAVARGSGAAVQRLGDLAAQSGIPVSLHGVGGAWLIADTSASEERFAAAVESSLDRKVCNTLNTCLIVKPQADKLVPVFVNQLRAAAARLGKTGRLHVLAGSEQYLDKALFDLQVLVDRGGQDRTEPFASTLTLDRLGEEWEWEGTPEVTLAVVDDLEHGIRLLNEYSPRFIATLIAQDPAAQDLFYKIVDAPFVGDGFTRWVDGQFALQEPELGLSNWAFGRPLGRSSILTGAAVHTVRLRMRQSDGQLRR